MEGALDALHKIIITRSTHVSVTFFEHPEPVPFSDPTKIRIPQLPEFEGQAAKVLVQIPSLYRYDDNYQIAEATAEFELIMLDRDGTMSASQALVFSGRKVGDANLKEVEGVGPSTKAVYLIPKETNGLAVHYAVRAFY